MAVEIKVPSAGESITEVMIAEWLVEEGDFVEMDQPVCTIETDKASMDIVAEASGTVKILVQEEEEVPVKSVIGSIEPGEGSAAPKKEEAPKAEEAAPAEAPQAAAPAKDSYAAGHPSPAAGVILEQKDLNAGDVQGTGKDGRITKEDALKAQKAAPAAKAAAPQAAPISGTEDLPQRREKMSMLRRKLAERLVNVKNQTAMLTTFNEVDMSAVMDIRKKYKENFKKKFDVNLGFMSFFTKAVTLALQEFPQVNAMIDGNEIVINETCNVGIAVSTPKGLVVPVVKHAQDLSFAEVEKTILGYALKARDGKITIQDMEHGTFTITNGGVFGSMLSTPIINPPQSAILGMHNIVQRPVAVNGQVEIRPVMYLALSYDHRIIDGRESVGFLKMVKDIIEDPYRYFLGM